MRLNINWLILLVLIICKLDIINSTRKKIKDLKPNIYADDYDSKTIALEFDLECLGNKSLNDILLLVMKKYPCLQHKVDNNDTHHHGSLYRKYMNYINDENNNNKCLEDLEIDWNEYCIHDISYDLILKINAGGCINDITNSIYYGTTKKPDAWNLDLIDGSENNIYKRPNIIANGDDHGIDIWILDSGIYSGHNEFYNGQIIDEVKTITYSGKHGTNAASIAGGSKYGASKGFYIHDYIVCGNTASGCAFSDIEKGLLSALNHMKTTGRRSVINLSIGSSGANKYESTKNYYDLLFNDIVNAGGIIVNAAGNSNTDACNWWFCYSSKVISVGAHDRSKKRASFSNYGPCVDIYAPGSYIPAANSITDPTNIGIISGTSFAAPMMVGVIANLLYEDRTRTKDQIMSILQSPNNRYAISNCPSGYCYGFYYRCTILTPNEFDNDNDNDNDNTNHGCCQSIRINNEKLSNYCRLLSLNDCINDNNAQYCFINQSC